MFIFRKKEKNVPDKNVPDIKYADKKIRIYGCSFTYGVWQYYDKDGVSRSPHTESWTGFFAKLLPNYEIINYATPGCSVKWVTYLFNKFKKKYPNDIHITQIPLEGRHNWWEDDLSIEDIYTPYKYEDIPNLTKHRRNHQYSHQLSVSILKNSQHYLRPFRKWTKQEISNWGKMYFGGLVNLDLEFMVWSYFLYDHADFAFHQKSLEDFPDLLKSDSGYKKQNFISFWDVIEQEPSLTTYLDYIVDNGHHLNPVALEFQANWVYQNIKNLL